MYRLNELLIIISKLSEELIGFGSFKISDVKRKLKYSLCETLVSHIVKINGNDWFVSIQTSDFFMYQIYLHRTNNL